MFRLSAIKIIRYVLIKNKQISLNIPSFSCHICYPKNKNNKIFENQFTPDTFIFDNIYNCI